MRPLILHCIECNEDIYEDILHRHLRQRHGLARAGVKKIRHNKQRPRYENIRVVVNAENMAGIFIRIAGKSFEDTNAELMRYSEDISESLPLQKLTLKNGQYKLAIQNGN